MTATLDPPALLDPPEMTATLAQLDLLDTLEMMAQLDPPARPDPLEMTATLAPLVRLDM
jgi:hypothetical protein